MNKRYLCHHGIPGQKWGKRNGPPYPLTKHSISERKALDKSTQKHYNKEKNIERGRYFVGSVLGDIGDKPVSEFISGSAGKFKTLDRPESVEEVLRNVNPTRSHNNCFNCVVAATARLCGLDVTARGNRADGKGVSFDEVCRAFKLDPDNPNDVIRIHNPDVNKVMRQIGKRYSEGDVGAIGFAWNDEYRKITGSNIDGHTINWVLRNGKPKLIDAQIGVSSEILIPTLINGIDTNHELSIAKFANVNAGIDTNNALWTFVR